MLLDYSPDSVERLSFGCLSLNELTDGGLPLGISEFYGEPGAGKSQLCLQLAVCSVQMDRHCIWINTEKQFPIDRLTQMVRSIPNRDPDELLEQIWIAETKDFAKMERLIERDLRLLLNNCKVGLLVVDSIAGLFRYLSDDYIKRAKVMRQFNRTLLKLQDQYKFTIVCTNQVSSSFDATPWTNESAVNPCLGPIWTEFLTNRFLVTNSKRCTVPSGLSIREFQVIFSPFLASGTRADFVVETCGIQSVD